MNCFFFELFVGIFWVLLAIALSRYRIVALQVVFVVYLYRTAEMVSQFRKSYLQVLS